MPAFNTYLSDIRDAYAASGGKAPKSAYDGFFATLVDEKLGLVSKLEVCGRAHRRIPRAQRLLYPNNNITTTTTNNNNNNNNNTNTNTTTTTNNTNTTTITTTTTTNNNNNNNNNATDCNCHCHRC